MDQPVQFIRSCKDDDPQLQRAWAVAATVCDPEIPVLTLADLGVLREVGRGVQGEIVLRLTPTYSGCPAWHVMREDVLSALAAANFGPARVEQVLSPAWTTDWMSEQGKRKLKAYGIAPPSGRARALGLFAAQSVACPRCDSCDTQQISEFGSTACKAHWRCLACREPFDYFKCL